MEDFQGQTVLLYFQEGLMCQPCWRQIKEIEQQWDDFAALGIDSVVSITTDPVGALEGLHSPVLSDRDLTVSRTYDTRLRDDGRQPQRPQLHRGRAEP